mgnify:CR=1 FL=1
MRSWRAKRIFSLGSRDLVSCVSEMHRTRVAREQQLRWDEEKGPEMTAIVAITVIIAIVSIVWGKKPPEITVTYLILGGLFPREVEMRFRDDAPDKLIASKAPERAFAFKRSDSMVYIDGEVLAVEDLVEEGLGDIARATIADGALSAVRLRDTNSWCPYYHYDRSVETDR